MEPDSWFTIKPRLHAKFFPSISNTTTLQASFVSWICVSILLKQADGLVGLRYFPVLVHEYIFFWHPLVTSTAALIDFISISLQYFENIKQLFDFVFKNLIYYFLAKEFVQCGIFSSTWTAVFWTGNVVGEKTLCFPVDLSHPMEFDELLCGRAFEKSFVNRICISEIFIWNNSVNCIKRYHQL